MKHLVTSLIAKLNGTKLGLGVLAVATGGTALALVPSSWWPDIRPPITVAPDIVQPVVSTDDAGVKITVKSSQGMMVQGMPDEVFLDVSIEVPAPTVTTGRPRRPTDMVLVLDRSGSMADGDKLTYAKAAMQSFVDRLGDQDRVALVTFDDFAVVEFPLTSATSSARSQLTALIKRLETGASTNIGDGLVRGGRELGQAAAGRSARVVLLSDGMPTTGATGDALVGIVKQLSSGGAVVSAIGMGLEFDETLLTKLADHGMGNYSYLASLTSLGQTLEKDLGDARAQFAAASRLQLELGEGVVVTDAGGYPIEQLGDGRVLVPLGQLLEGSTRNFVVSVRPPTHKLGEQSLARVELTYDRDGATRLVKAGDVPIKLAIVAPERGHEAVASIDGNLFRKSWVTNNVGRMKKEFSGYLRDGRQEEAKRVLNDYKTQLQAAGAASGVATKDEALEQELGQLDRMADDAFEGSAGEQQQKMKAYAKESLSSAIGSQRNGGKKP